MKTLRGAVVLFVACLVVAGHLAEADPAPAVAPRGDRVLAMDVGAGEGESLASAIAAAKAAGVEAVVRNYNWADLEPAMFDYRASSQHHDLDADNLLFSAPATQMKLILNIRPIAGPCSVVSPDLANVPWNHSFMKARFAALLDFIHSRLPNVQIALVSIGTEVDSHLDTDAGYLEYQDFFEAGRTKVKQLWGTSTPVVMVTSWAALTAQGGSAHALAEQMWILRSIQNADHAAYTYYSIGNGYGGFGVKDPWNDTISDVNLAANVVASWYPAKKIDLIETGIPTSAAVNGADYKQVHFVQALFGLWDVYHTSTSARINTIVFNWQTDTSTFDAAWIAAGSWGGGGCGGGGQPPAAPPQPTVTPVGGTGSSTWQYYVIAVDPSGGISLPSPATTITHGVAAVSSTTFNRISWSPVSGAAQYYLVRVKAGGGTQPVGRLLTSVPITGTTFDDTGHSIANYEFQEFIRSMGYRLNPAPVTPKPAWSTLDYEAAIRGW